jgi:Holliday junction resolvase
MPESRLQSAAIDLLEKRGWYVVNNWGTPLAHSGVPDLVCCARGEYVALETKYLDGKTSKAQDLHIRKIRRAGGLVYVPYTLDDVERIAADAGFLCNRRPFCLYCSGEDGYRGK